MLVKLLGAMASGSLLAGTAAAAVSVDLSKGKREVVFKAVGKPSFLKITGEDEDEKGLSGTVTKDGDRFGGKAIFKLDVLTTGIDLRDEHMKEKYLQTKQHPNAELVIKQLPWGKDDKSDFEEKKGPFKGEFTVRGVTKPVEGEATVARQSGKIEAEVSFKFKITDYGIELPSFQGVTVAEDVTVELEIESPVTGS